MWTEVLYHKNLPSNTWSLTFI